MLSFVFVLHQVILVRLFLEKFCYGVVRLFTKSFAFFQTEDMHAAILSFWAFDSSALLCLQAKIGCLLCMFPALYAKTSLCTFAQILQ